MVRQRIKAIFEFAISVFVLWFVLRVRKSRYDHTNEVGGNEPEPLSLGGVATGAATSIVSVWLSDHDVWKIRTNRCRRLLFGLVWNGSNRIIGRLTSNPDSFRESHSLGGAVGLVAYCLWYGILHPLPGSSE